MSKDFGSIFSVDQESYLLGDLAQLAKIPEKRLLFAMCERAVRDLFSSETDEQEDAKNWLRQKDSQIAFSFPWICEVLDLNREQLLYRIMRLVEVGKNYKNSSREIYALINASNQEEKSLRAAA